MPFMPLSVRLASADSVQPLRERFRQEAAGQIVHDSLHSRRGWTDTYLFEIDGRQLASPRWPSAVRAG
jgi:hypothetical protein